MSVGHLHAAMMRLRYLRHYCNSTSYTVFVSAAFCDFHIVFISCVCTSWRPIWIKISLRRHCDLTLCQLLMYCIDGCVYCKVMQRILHDWCVYRLVMQYIVQMSASPFLASISSLGMSLVAAHKPPPHGSTNWINSMQHLDILIQYPLTINKKSFCCRLY